MVDIEKTVKIVAPLTVAVGVTLAANASGVTESMAEWQQWNQSLTLEFARDFMIPAGKWIYNCTAGFLAGLGTSWALDKYVYRNN